MPSHQLTEIRLADSPANWAACGFEVVDDRFAVGTTTIVCDPSQSALSGAVADADELDGLALHVATAASSAQQHALTAFDIDHVVVRTPAPDRTTASFEGAGLEARRERRIESPKGTMRQTFFWMGDVICEVVGPDDGRSDEPAQWWGWALSVRNLDAAVALLGEYATPSKAAVQPGRYVSTLRHPDIVTPTLLISPHKPGHERADEPA